VLPGQGAIRDCMRELRDSGMLEAVLDAAARKPMLGVCVGMQMLLDHSEEQDTPGLGLIPGTSARGARAPAPGRPERRLRRQAGQRAALLSRRSSRRSADEIPIQLGGGIRDLDTIERYLDDGLSYIIIGTAAVKSPGFLKDACTAFGGHIIVGLDAKDGKVATDGWSKLTGHEVVDLALKFQDYGVEGVIYTDIGRDGMLTGINIDATVKLAQALTIPVFASGGLPASPTSRSCARSRTKASKA
jgi:uncharacterized protein related to proFAR isomerase